MKKGFDNKKYIETQTAQIRERIDKFGNKLYLEFGGKLFDDYHASRVLPGFDVNGKIRLLQEFKDSAEIIFCISAHDIERNKIRSDIGISYDEDLLRLVDSITSMGLTVSGVVITQYNKKLCVDAFQKKIESKGIRTYRHYSITGYPSNIDLVVSEDGFGQNDYIETTKPLVVVTAPGPCSGKMATCLSQLYHEHKRGILAGYAKFETFPIWNLPLKHPVNLAYEAATADIKDVNMIDPYHLEAYNERTVNYNRDIEVFPIVKTILNRIIGYDIYKSPTDMGVNMAGYAIFDDEQVKFAANQEIIRRYFKINCEFVQGTVDQSVVDNINLIMNQAGLKPYDRAVVPIAREKAEIKKTHAFAIQLDDEAHTVVTGKESNLMTAPASAILNAVKTLCRYDDDLLLLSPVVLEPILKLKKDFYNFSSPILHLDEILIALSISAATNPMANKALSKLSALKNAEAHSTTMLRRSDESSLKKLGINITCDSKFY